MTGSGSAVFAPMNTAAGSASDNPPHEAEFAMLPKGWRIRQCSNLDAHPLRGWAD